MHYSNGWTGWASVKGKCWKKWTRSNITLSWISRLIYSNPPWIGVQVINLKIKVWIVQAATRLRKVINSSEDWRLTIILTNSLSKTKMFSRRTRRCLLTCLLETSCHDHKLLLYRTWWGRHVVDPLILTKRTNLQIWACQETKLLKQIGLMTMFMRRILKGQNPRRMKNPNLIPIANTGNL